jgi:hypothetical protein
MLDFENDIKIDDSKLHLEWEDQPILYKKYSDAWAQADNERVEAKDNYDFIYAQEYKKLADSSTTGKKLTIKDFENELALNEKIIEAKKAVNKAAYNSNVLANAKNAFEQRKKALEKLVDLWGMQYFGKPKTTENRNTTFTNETGHSRPGLRNNG